MRRAGQWALKQSFSLTPVSSRGLCCGVNGLQQCLVNQKFCWEVICAIQYKTINFYNGDIAWKIAEGRGAMPGFKERLTDEQIWDLVNFIQSLKETFRD